jgi:hypothetical protein
MRGLFNHGYLGRFQCLMKHSFQQFGAGLLALGQASFELIAQCHRHQ